MECIFYGIDLLLFLIVGGDCFTKYMLIISVVVITIQTACIGSLEEIKIVLR